MKVRLLVEGLLLAVTGAALCFHAAGWLMALVVLTRTASPAMPLVQSAIVIALGFAVSRAASARRAQRRVVVVGALAAAAAWHRWSRQSCRYVGLALATPLCLLYFGYWELGYLSMAAGAAPLLAIGRSRRALTAQASAWVAGCLQGLHTALHGFGLFGIAGGTLAALEGR